MCIHTPALMMFLGRVSFLLTLVVYVHMLLVAQLVVALMVSGPPRHADDFGWWLLQHMLLWMEVVSFSMFLFGLLALEVWHDVCFLNREALPLGSLLVSQVSISAIVNVLNCFECSGWHRTDTVRSIEKIPNDGRWGRGCFMLVSQRGSVKAVVKHVGRIASIIRKQKLS